MPALSNSPQLRLGRLFPMVIRPIAMPAKPQMWTPYSQTLRSLGQRPPACICRSSRVKSFSSSAKLHRQQKEYRDSFGTRLRKALGETRVKWYPIPVGLGIGFLGLGQLYRINQREKARRRDEEWEEDGQLSFSGSRIDGEPGNRPKRRERIRPTGPWWVFSGISWEGVVTDVF